MSITPDHPDEGHQCSTVAQAARYGQLEDMIRLIKDGHPVDVADNRGWRPTHEAAHGNFLDCLAILLQQDGVDVNWTSFEGSTALLLAAGEGNVECMRHLLDNDANPNIPDAMDQYPLFQAVKSKKVECVKLLLEHGANVNCQLYCGTTPLHQASAEGLHSIVEVLLDAGAKLDICEEYGITSLFSAAQYGQVTCLEILLKKAALVKPGLMNKAADDGAVPLFLASQEGHVDCVKMLLKYGADANRMTEDNPALPLHAALQFNHVSCVDLLLPNTNRALFIHCEGSPFHFAMDHEDSRCTQLLISHGVSVDYMHSIQSVDGYIPRALRYSHAGSLFKRKVTPLTAVALTGANIRHAGALLKANARVVPHFLEVPALLPALDNFNLPLSELLLKNGAPVNLYHPYLCGNLTIMVTLHYWRGLNLVLSAGAEVRTVLEKNKLSAPSALPHHHSDDDNTNDSMNSDGSDECSACVSNQLEVFSFVRIMASARYVMSRNGVERVQVLRRLLAFAGNVSLNPALCSLVDSPQEWKSLTDVTESARSLAHYSRLVVRCCVGSWRLMHQEALNSLPIPPVLLDYILFKDILS